MDIISTFLCKAGGRGHAPPPGKKYFRIQAGSIQTFANILGEFF
jgi:hypothetical protein